MTENEDYYAYRKTIKTVPTQHLIDWLDRHPELEHTDQHIDYWVELELRQGT